ncbi:protein kinase domain-containing protein [Marisediminicola sp. LYQ85]|uniref:protein kinase domain-containing protein n=1 Tax=Marisediminicola sp. LYQ85 TaxID=3391062 RepID=UPI0039830F10
MQNVAGFRVIRLLGASDDADVYLGTSLVGAHPDGVALKVYRSTAPAERVESEIDTLTRVDHRHVVRVLDLASHEGVHPVAVLQRLRPAPLHRLFERGEPLSAGEVVTLCAPVVSAVRHLHSRGISHGGLACSSVLFDASGAPVLTGFTASTVITDGATPPTEAALADSAEVVADLAALDTLVAAVIRSSTLADSLSAAQWREATDAAAPSTSLHALESALFDLASPTPVRFTIEAHARLVAAGIEFADDARELGETAERALIVIRSLHVPEWLEPVVTTVLEKIATARDRVRFELGRVRRRVWIAGAAAATIVTVCFAALPAVESASDAAERPAAVGPSSRPSGSAEPPAPSGGTEPSARLSEPAGGPAGGADAIGGDDPVAAARALLVLRESCLAEGSLSCVERVVHAGSALAAADAHLVRDGRSGGVATGLPDLSDADPSLVDRTGASALVSVTDRSWPEGSADVSVHLIETPAGWRLRDIIVG